jgi:hypothetical protein
VFGASPQRFDLGSGQFPIDAVQSINSVPWPRHHQCDLPNLRNQPAEKYLSRLFVLNGVFVNHVTFERPADLAVGADEIDYRWRVVNRGRRWRWIDCVNAVEKTDE